MKCSAILGDFFMKSNEVILNQKIITTNEGKSESNIEEKILGLFDDDLYREERKLRRISSCATYFSHCFHQISILVFVGIIVNL